MSRGAPRRASVPFVSQSTEVDCGAACLVMALAARGKTFHLHEVREAVGVGRDGVNAADICDGARQLGFRARAARIEIDALALLPSGTILHWELRHFVVFEAVTREGGAVIVDPAVGRRRVSARELDRALTGIAILIEPGESVATAKEMRRPTRSFLWSIVTGSPEVAKILVASVALQVLAGLFPILSASVVDRVVPRHDVDMLSVLALGLAVLTVFFGAFSLLRGYLLANLRTRVDFAGAARLLEHLVSLPLPYFQERSAGDLMVRVRSNEVLREALSTSMLASVLDGSLVAIYLCALVWILPPVALVVAGLTIVNATVYLAFRRRHKELVAEAQHRQGVADGHLIDTITGIETLKVAGAEGRATTKWTSLYVDVLNASLKKARLATWTEGVGGTIRMAGPFVVLLVGARGVLAGDISLGTLLSALALAQGIIVSSAELLGNLSQLDTMSALVSRVDDVLLAEPEQPEARPIAPVLTGRIALRGVGYKPSARARHIVREVSLNVPKGALVALVGESGSGKSTLASLLAGLVTPTEGEVTYDGVPIDAMDLPSLRRQMGVVVQRTQVFGSSIRDNITMLEDFPLSEIEEAARLACIHDDISAMGMRYQTPLVAGGAVSGGQRQRIALARALIRKPKVLLLDEATSALDAITERRIFDNIGHMGCTRIVVAHRLSTILEADLIVVMKEGKVVETGRHAELVERDGVYAKLVLAQTDTDRDASEPLRRSA